MHSEITDIKIMNILQDANHMGTRACVDTACGEAGTDACMIIAYGYAYVCAIYENNGYSNSKHVANFRFFCAAYELAAIPA